MKVSTPLIPQLPIRLTSALCAILFLAVAPVVVAGVTPPPSYVVEDLGALPGDVTSVASGINASGDVVGWSTSKYGSRAFLYSDGAGMVELPALGEGDSRARDINDSREIVGTSAAIKGLKGRAVLWVDGKVNDLGTLQGGGGSDAWAINNSGQIVGSVAVGDFIASEHAFLYEQATGMVDLTPDLHQAVALDINDAGEITGYCDASDGSQHAFYWLAKELVDLGELPGFGFSSGAALNEKGLVVGTATSPGSKQAHMFSVDAATAMKDLNGKLGVAFALAVNSAGDVVGYVPGVTTTRAILYTQAAGVRDLNTLISQPKLWTIEGATDINDAGVIVGYAYNAKSRQSHAVRLRPAFAPFPG